MAAKLRASQAIDLLIENHTYEEIAALAGYGSRSAAFNAINRELERHLDLSTGKLRKIENSRIQRIMAKVYHEALGGNLWAVDRYVALSTRYSKLNGLDMDNAELVAAMPYQKRIVLEDQPSVPAIGEVVE